MPGEPRRFRRRFWWESITAGLSALLVVMTLLWHDWLEAFGVDPDHGDGSAEWLVTVLLLALSISLGVVARLEWRRTATATA